LEYKNIIDLHIHSKASDGSYTPAEIIDMAIQLGVRAISITDHDTIEGSREAQSIHVPSTLEIIAGVEISADLPTFCYASSSLHMLGYCIELDNPELNQMLNDLQLARFERTPLILKRLRKFGVEITFSEVQDRVGESQPGRPHIAQVLLQKGIVATFQEAFDRFLGKGKPAYVEKYRLNAEQAIKAIIAADGIPVLAHPTLLRLNQKELTRLIQYLKSVGLQGIEVYYPEHSSQEIQFYEKLANENELLMTGGTDFHGRYRPKIQIGIGKGDFCVPYQLFETLMQHHSDRINRTTPPISITSDIPNYGELEKKLNYTFRNEDHIQEALQHSSYVNENPDITIKDNERYEFLGDAVLNLVIGHLLMIQFPDVNEGDLSRMRAMIVNEKQLAMITRKLSLQEHLLLGKGEIQTKGHEKQSILADTLEAIIAAVYMDGGFEQAFKFIHHHFSFVLKQARIQDYKSELQEFAQGELKEIPVYKVIDEVGPDHRKIFIVELKIGELVSRGSGKSKKNAEQEAARLALIAFKNKD